MTIYSPWGNQPLPNRSPIVIVEDDRFIFKSPQRVNIVRLHTQPNISRIRFPIPALSSSQVEPDNSRQGDAHHTRAPLAGFFFQGSSAPRFHALQKPKRGFAYRFQSVLRVVGLFHDRNTNREVFECPTISIPKTEKQFPRES
jgi:hypothetical protein